MKTLRPRTDGVLCGLSARALICLVVLSVMIWGAAWLADRAERVIHLRLDCDDGRCQVRLDGGDPLTLDLPDTPPGERLGLYAYSPYERRGRQHFRNLRIRTGLGLASSYSLERVEETPSELLMSDGWHLVPGVGFGPRDEPGERAHLLLDGVYRRNFSLEIDLVSPLDAGIAFHATETGDGTVFVVRPYLNDAFFFRLKQGRPSEILALRPWQELTWQRELLRVGGLVAQITLASIAFLLLFALLARLAPAAGGISSKLPDRWLRSPNPPSWIIPVLFPLTLVALAAVGIFGLQGVPHLADETAYLFQAKIFAAGDLWAAPPAEPDFFLHDHIVITPERWFAKYPPGFPALLALGVLAGLPWLVNPLLGALTAWVIYGMTRDLAGWRWALGAWLLILTSPFFLIMGGAMMSHMACALFVSLFVWLLLRGVNGGRLPTLVGAGGCLGVALLIRPFTALVVSIAAAGWLLAKWIGSARKSALVRAAAVLVLSTLPFVAAYVGWSALLADSARPLEFYSTYDTSDRLGFGPDKGAGWLMTWGSWGHTPAKALRSFHQYLSYSSVHLLGWPAGLSFALVFAYFVSRRRRSSGWLLSSVFVALAAGHLLYWATQHIGYGARYWFSAAPCLIVLSLLGARSLISSTPHRPAATLGIATLVVALVAVNLSTYLPVRLRELPCYGGISADLKQAVLDRKLENAVVFVRTQGLLFNDGFFMNDPWLRRGTVFARDLGPRNAELLARYPDRRGFRWAEGQLTAIVAEDIATAQASLERGAR